MYRLPLNWPGSDQRNLDCKVVEGPRLHLRESRHLRSRFHLKYTNGVCLGEHAIDGRFLGYDCQVYVDSMRGFDHVGRQMKSIQHAESEKVKLHYADGCTVILVPLDDRSILHPPPFEWYHLPQRPIGNHHAA